MYQQRKGAQSGHEGYSHIFNEELIEYMLQLEESKGIPRKILLMMAIVSGLTVANLYYNQPLLEDIRKDIGINELQANLITFITQAGYAMGLLFVVPLADMWSRRRIIATSMVLATIMTLVIATT